MLRTRLKRKIKYKREINLGLDFHDDLNDGKFSLRSIKSYATSPDQINTFFYASPAGVGIGTTSPTTKLDVAGTANITGATTLRGTLTINETTGTLASSTPTSTRGTIVLEHQNAGGGNSIVFKSKQNPNSDYGYIQYIDTIGTAGTELSQLTIGVENDSSGKNEDSINFRLNNADRVKISGEGNVGIATTNPSEKLDVSGNINANGIKLGDFSSVWTPKSSTTYNLPQNSFGRETGFVASKGYYTLPGGLTFIFGYSNQLGDNITFNYGKSLTYVYAAFIQKVADGGSAESPALLKSIKLSYLTYDSSHSSSDDDPCYILVIGKI